MKRIITLGALTATTVLTTTSLSAYNADSFIEVYDLFSNNIEEMTNAFEVEYNIEWNASKIEDITYIYSPEDDKIGYLVIFDEGYLAYSNELSVYDVHPTEYPSFYKNSFLSTSKAKVVYNCGEFENDSRTEIATFGDLWADDIYYPLRNYYEKDGFQINTSMVPIPYFQDLFPDAEWGNIQGITFSYAAPNCGGVMAMMSLMYTMKLNGGMDLTPSQTSYKDFMQQLNFYIGFNYTANGTSFVDVDVLYSGIENYLNLNFGEEVVLTALTSVDTYSPAVTLYYNMNGLYTAEYCMRIGHAQEPSWWIFNTYYDIVMANHNNFYLDEFEQPALWFSTSISPYYVVNQNYREMMFQFYKDGEVLL